MKVLVAGTGGGFVSGISSVADQHERLLRAAGHDVVRVVAGERARRRPNRMNLENALAVLGDAVAVARTARRERAQVLWYHTFGVPTLPAVRALLVALGARAAGCDVVVHVHAFGLEDTVADGGRALRTVLGLLGRIAGAVVVLHDAAAEALAPVLPDGKLLIVPNWVELDEPVLPLPDAPPWRLVFVGGLVARKGIWELLDAVELIHGEPGPEVVLRLVGGAGEDGPEALARLHARVDRLVSEGLVELAGEVSPDQVRTELDRSHLLVLPSRAEGTPMAMLEAMAAGRAVLVGEAGDAHEIVAASQGGAVLGGLTAEDIAGDVRRLVGDPAALQAMALAGRRYVEAEHDPATAGRRVEAILGRFQR